MYIDIDTKIIKQQIENNNINKLFLLSFSQKNIIKDNNIYFIVPKTPFKESK